MTRSGQKVVARGHLSLAMVPAGAPAAPSRAALVLRAVLARMRILVQDFLAVAGAILALAPLLIRRRPLGHRTQVPRAASRVIAFQARRRASPT